jgi:hypothetical protein
MRGDFGFVNQGNERIKYGADKKATFAVAA